MEESSGKYFHGDALAQGLIVERMVEASGAMLAQKIDSILPKVSSMEHRLKAMDTRETAPQVSRIEHKLEKMDAQVSRMEHKLEKMDTTMRTAVENIQKMLACHVEALTQVVQPLCHQMDSVLEKQSQPIQSSVGSFAGQGIGRDPCPKHEPHESVSNPASIPRQEPLDMDIPRQDSLAELAPTLLSPTFDTERRNKLVLDDDYYDIDTDDILPPHPDNIGALFGSLFGCRTEVDHGAHPYRVENFYKNHGCAQELARHPNFIDVTSLVVFLNAVYIVIESTANFEPNVYDQPVECQIISQSFCIYFFVELVIRYLAFESKYNCLRDGWFRLDLVLCSMMVFDYWIYMPFFHFIMEGSSPKIPGQPLRFLRLIKLSRLTHVFKFLPEVVVMIRSMVQGCRSILSAVLLTLLMTYISGLFLHSLMKNEDEVNDMLFQQYEYRFSSLSDVCWFLFMCGVLQLDNTALVIGKLVYSGRVACIVTGFYLLAFTLAANVLVLQMVIALLCDVVSRVSCDQNELETISMGRKYLLKHLRDILDKDSDGRVSKDELVNVMLSPEPKAFLKKLKINRSFFSEIASLLYIKEDTKVPINVIMELLFNCRGDITATVDVIASGLSYINNQFMLMESRVVAQCNEKMHGQSMLIM